MNQNPMFMLLVAVSVVSSALGTYEIGDRYGGVWDGVNSESSSTGGVLRIQGAEVTVIMNGNTHAYTCTEADEQEASFLLRSANGYNCVAFLPKFGTLVITVVSKDGSLNPIEVPEGVEPNMANLCNGGNFEKHLVMDILRREESEETE